MKQNAAGTEYGYSSEFKKKIRIRKQIPNIAIIDKLP